MPSTPSALQRPSIVLALLSATYAINYVDRQILSVVLEPLRLEFGLSDAMLGLLAGPAFALFYATMGVPIAIMADRYSRIRIITLSLACFSIATAACGWVTYFWQLLLARVLTGVGEAGTGPASQSIITDLFPPDRRGRAQAIYAVGVNIGLMVAFVGGGWIVHHHGWRAGFLVAGIPGILLALLMAATVQEPPRQCEVETAAAPSMRETLAYLRSQRSYCWIVLASGLSAFSGYGVTTFVPAFLMRSHGLDVQQVGLVLALIVGIGGGAATFASGLLVDRLRRRSPRWYVGVPILGALASLPFWPVFLLAGDPRVAIVAAIAPLSLSATYIGPCIAAMQALVPPRMRARAAATQLFLGNLIGLGLGPQIIGLVSDWLAPFVGRDSLRYALLAGVCASMLAIFSYWRASLSIAADMARLGEARAPESASTLRPAS
ncbi:spinster family MFS transporter [Flavisphingomonas formosensis]|uniref:spinster family MFS transporter n=1 Tax=Flavisphingomonas formosensis TaxID=861534 RepID=UPI0012FB5EA3|nr:MFS transporter [Sphingomonas formosensis]